MFNRANEGFARSLFGATATVERPDPGRFEDHIEQGATVLHVLRTDSGIEHETDEYTTTVEPGGDAAYTVVTDRRFVVFLADEPEVAFELTAIEHAALHDHLLSTTFEVGTDAETLRFTPVDVGEAEAAARSIDAAVTAWEDLEAVLADVRAIAADVEAGMEAGRDPTAELDRARSRLATARDGATNEESVSTALADDAIEPVEATLADLGVRARVAYVEALLTDLEAAREGDDVRVAYETFLEATAIVADVDEAVARRSDLPDVVGERVETVSTHTRSHGESLLEDAFATCERAHDATDPESAVAEWTTAREHYGSALAAGWTDEADTDAEAIRYQLAWVVGRQIDALVECARGEERAGDRGDGDETERFETAKVGLEVARATAAEHPHADPERIDDALERVEAKFERSRWQWGRAEA